MKLTLIVFLLFCAFVGRTQIITTIAGTGAVASTGDGGPATAASVNMPFVCTFDGNQNFYFTEVGIDKVRKIDPAGVITLIAGGGSSPADGIPATDAKLNNPNGIATDQFGNIYICDALSFRVRKVSASTGVITTVAGTGVMGFSGDDGPATAAKINPNNICLDRSGNIYILDAGNNRVRKVNTVGVITTIAGNGTPLYLGDGGAATAASLKALRGICADVSGNVYFTQMGDNVVRKISTSGIITKVAGNGGTSGGDEGPATAAGIHTYEIHFDKFGNMYVSGYISNVVRRIDRFGYVHKVAGDGTGSFGGDGGPATAAQLKTPIGITTDSCGNLYVADRDDHHIRKITYSKCNFLEADNPPLLTNQLSIYPNPTNDILHIDNLQTPATYKLLNMVGSIMQEGSLKKGSNSVNIERLPAGVYMLELSGEDGIRNVTRVVKE